MIFSTHGSHLDSSSSVSIHVVGILDFPSFGRMQECWGEAVLHRQEKAPTTVI